MIVHTCFNNSSYHGYKSSILKSGICKYTRRNEPEKMKWCVLEMARFREHEKGDGLVTNLVNRLKILIMEELSFHQIGLTSQLIKLICMYDVDRTQVGYLGSFCDLVFECKRNRAVSYQNAWWRNEPYEEKSIQDTSPMDPYIKPNDSPELIQIGCDLLRCIETNDERMFQCYFGLLNLGNQGLRYRRKDPGYLWFELLKTTMNTESLKCIFDFALEMYHRKNMKERNAFAIWIGLIVWKKDTLVDIPAESKALLHRVTNQDINTYYETMTKLVIDDYVIHDYHVNSKKYDVGHFADNGAMVVDEYLDFFPDADEKKRWYSKEKKLKQKYAKKKSAKKTPKPKEIIETIDWSEFSDVKILEDGVCGGKVCCIQVNYQGSRYILKEMKESMNYGLDYMLVDKCKSLFNLRDMNMRRIQSNRGQVKKDTSRISFVGNVEIGTRDCIYCMMDYWDNIGDLGKHKYKMDDPAVKREALKIRLFDGLFRSSDNIPRNILVNEAGDLLSIDEGDIYGKRKQVFNKNDWFTKKEHLDRGLFKDVLDELLQNEATVLPKIKDLFQLYQFMNYEMFEERFKNYREIISSEVGL